MKSRKKGAAAGGFIGLIVNFALLFFLILFYFSPLPMEFKLVALSLVWTLGRSFGKLVLGLEDLSDLNTVLLSSLIWIFIGILVGSIIGYAIDKYKQPRTKA
jgi:hypothetical protein